MNDGIDEIRRRLLDWTKGSTASEQLAAQLLQADGYKHVDPTHPHGGRDGGKDAECIKDGTKWIMAAYFPRGQKDFPQILKKFKGDAIKAKRHGVAGIVFVTNQELRDSQRAILRASAEGLAVDILHLDRLSSILDRPEMERARVAYLGLGIGVPRRSVQEWSGIVRAARKIVRECLPAEVFLPYWEAYDFGTGRVPLDLHNAQMDLRNNIHFVGIVADRGNRVLAKEEAREMPLLSPLRLEILDALPALERFYNALDAHCGTISEVTGTEDDMNSGYLGIYRNPMDVRPNDPNFGARVHHWRETALYLATVYREDILGESFG